jgi:restriction endonuclease S subunit
LKTTLGHIAIIQTGIFAKPTPEGEIIYLQAKHFDENGSLASSLHPDLKAEDISEKHLLQAGDVLFASKGTRNFASWYESKNQPAVASTSFFVIRLQSNLVIPEYLAWYLNSPYTLKILKGRAIGTSIVSISKTVLENLEISVPELNTQQIILKINQLQIREKSLMHQREILNEKKIQQLIINALK